MDEGGPVSEWRDVPLRDLCHSVQYGVTASAAKDRNEGPRLLRITDIVPPRIDWESVPVCDLPETKIAKYQLHQGDIVVARSGSVGYAKLVDHPPRRAVFASYLVRFQVQEGIDARYVGHVVQSTAYREFVIAHAGGAAQPNANAKTLGAFPVPIPTLPTQRRIAAALSAFDELIEINERRIELLEDLARSLYREWFVRFRFPGHAEVDFMSSELGSVPDEWAVRRLGDVASLNKRILRATDLPDPLRYLDISSVGVGRLNEPTVIEAARAPGRARRSLRDGDVLWATVRPNRRAHGLVHDPPPDLVASTGLAAISPASIPASFLFLHVSHPAFTEYLVSRATGSAYPAVRPIDFEQAPIVVPSASILEAFDQVAAPSLRLASALVDQNRALARGRDLLLPRLVTGRLDISDIDLGELLPPEAA